MFDYYTSNITAFTNAITRYNRFADEAAARGDHITELNNRRGARQSEAIVANLILSSQKVGR